MNGRPGAGPRLLRRGPALRSVVLVRLTVDRRAAELPRDLHGTTLPPGTAVRLDVGGATSFVDYWNELANLVRDCAEIEIVGTDPAGVASVRDHLARAFARMGAPAC